MVQPADFANSRAHDSFGTETFATNNSFTTVAKTASLCQRRRTFLDWLYFKALLFPISFRCYQK
jgi:hypothetical protein